MPRRLNSRLATARRDRADGFDGLFQVNPIACVIEARDGERIVDANPAFVEMMGQLRSSLLGRTLNDLGLRAAPLKQNAEQSDTANSENERYRLQNADGRELHLLLSVWPIVHRGRGARLRMLRDVTDQCRSRGALRSSEDRLAAIMNNIQLMIAEITVDGVLINANSAALEAAGPNREAVIGKPFDQTAWFTGLPMSQAQLVDAIQLARRGETVRHDIEYCMADGQICAADFMLVPLRDASGQTVRLIASGIDVSARRAAEQAVRESEQRLRMRVDNTAFFLGEMSVDGILLDVNRAALDSAAVSREEVIGKPLAQTYWFDHSERGRDAARSAIATAKRGEMVRMDIDVRVAEGRLVPIDFMLAPVFDQQGKVCKLIPSAVDISERQSALRQLQRSRSLLEAALDQARMGPWEFDPRADQFTFSDRFFELLATDAGREGGYRMSSADFLREFCHPDDQAAVYADFLTAVKSAATDRASILEYRVTRRDGLIRHMASRFDIVRAADGRAIGLHGANQDLTEQKLIEQQLREQRDMQSMLSGAAAGLLEVPSALMDGAIDQTLRKCGEWLGADRAYLFVHSNDPQLMRKSHQWFGAGIEARTDGIENLSLDRNPWLQEQLTTVGLVVVADLATLPVEATAERRHLEALQISSLFAIPLRAMGGVSGYIGFHAIRRPRDWSISDGALLKVLGEIVGSALNKQRAEQALRLLAKSSAISSSGAFLGTSVEALAQAAMVRLAMVAMRNPDDRALATTLAVWDTDHIVENFTYVLTDSPCEHALDSGLCVYRERVAQLFPKDRWLAENAIESYVGVPLFDEDGLVLGHLALLDDRPRPYDAEMLTYVQLFADRIAGELIRRRADEALRLSEAGLRATLDSTRDGILAVDDQGEVRFANQRMSEMWGLTEDLALSSQDDRQLVQVAARQLIDPQAFLDKVQELYGSDRESEDMLEFVDGRVFERYSKPLLTEGAIAGRVWSFHDITAGKKLEAALHVSRHQLDQAMDAADMAAWEYDPIDGIFTWNARFYALLGTTAEREGGYRMAARRYIAEFCHPQDAYVVEQAIADGMGMPDPERSYSADYRIIRRDSGALRDVAVNYRVGCDVNGKAIRAWGALQDVTDHRQATLELARLNSELERRVEERSAALRVQQAAAEVMLENLAEGVVACDGDGRLTLFNKTSREWYGCDPSELSPDSWPQYFQILEAHSSAELAADRHPLTRAYAGEQVRDFEMQIRRKGEAARQVLVNGGPVVDETGASLGAMIAMHDVSQRTRQIEDRVARERAEQASRDKSGFLAAMSHEIRTPMNAVLGLVEVLGCGELTPHQSDLVNTVQQSARQLLRLIDNILDFSKIEAGRLELEQSPLALAGLVEGVVKTLATYADQQRVSLRLFIAPSIPASLLGDETALRQVIYNLLGNAIKFSSGRIDHTGRVDLRLEVNPDAAKLLRLTISDNGIGMGPEVLKKLFTPFTQGEATTTRRFGGTGLGLAICKRIIDLMGGTVKVSSQVGVGSIFAVDLPYQPDDAAPVNAPAKVLAGVHCLLVGSDEVYDAANLQVYLESAGASVQRVDNDELPALIAAGEPLARPDSLPLIERVLVRPPRSLDIDLNNIRQLLIGSGRRRRLRVIDTQTFGIDADGLCLADLVHAVETAVGRVAPPNNERPREARNLAISEASRSRGAGRLILVAEDDPINQMVISHQLNMLGHVAEIAADGAEALRLWRSGKYALLLADLNMPLLDGYELTRAIRSEERARADASHAAVQHMPILALTANALRDEEHRARELGMDAYLTKPISLDTLSQTLQKWLSQPSTFDEAGSDGSGKASAIGAAAIDLDLPMRLVGGDPEMLRELLGDYVEAAQSMAESLRQAAVNADCPGAGSIAHNFKSSARTIGALTIGLLCAEIETASRSGDLGAVTRGIDQLQPLHRRVIDEITQIINEGNS